MTQVRPRSLSAFTQGEIQRLFQNSERVAGVPGIEIRKAPQQREYGRILIVTPRRVGKASIRNKIRRQIKAIFYEQQLYKNGSDFAVLVRPGADSLSFDDIKQLLLTACA